MSSLDPPCTPLQPLPLPEGVSSRLIQTRDLTFHILEAGATPARNRPLILLLHGFPEIAYSWRRVLPRLAAAGFYAVAPDQRGFGRTTGWDTREFKDVNLATFSMTELVRDIVVLVHALGYRSVQCVVGHDCGAVTAATCTLIRPDFFRSVVLMSHPFNGSPVLPFNTANHESTGAEEHDAAAKGGGGGAASSTAASKIHEDLAKHGRKHYKWYYSTPQANQDMSSLPFDQLHRFLRGYFYLKSGSWPGNKPVPLKSWTADELIQMPGYYIMPLHASMPETVEQYMQQEQAKGVSSQSWLPDEELAVYTGEYIHTGFQGGLNWYRVQTSPDGRYKRDYDTFAGKKIECPCAFVSGRLDWGIYQEPGALERMAGNEVCSDFRILRLLDGVGHWIPQESPNEVVQTIIELTNALGDGY